MLINRRTRLRQRRGVALILILGMLGLLALIGVTFATFTGQARIGARNYALASLRPQSGELMDFALSQLIGDTNDVRSAIRGHSLARDMYGNDAANNGYVDYNPANTVNGQLLFIDRGAGPNGTLMAETNIPVGLSAFYGYDFTRWVVKFESRTGTVNSGVETRLIGQTFEVLGEDLTGTNRVFYLTPPADPMGVRDGYISPDGNASLGAATVQGSQLIGEAAGGVPLNVGFVLDGRFLRAFNGPGMGYTSAVDAPGPGNLAPFANMRYNGGILSGNNAIVTAGDPNAPGVPSMDEDYDAADVENWFLALQSADGKVIIPSFHRPGILGYYAPPSGFGLPPDTDWSRKTAESRSKILRPRKADGHDSQTFPDLRPNDSTGRIEYDVDNDGDGLTDSVWVDLGYPAIKDSRGMLYKPMFAFMVIGLNGRIPLNTAGNLQMRSGGGGSALHMHTARLGTSPSEVDPTFGLQNAPPTVIDLDADGNPLYEASTYQPQFDDATTLDSDGNEVFAPVGVNVTQLRNILTGTRPDPDGLYGDANILMYPDGTASTYVLPNNMLDLNDDLTLPRAPVAVAGRWGERGLISPEFNVDEDNLAAEYMKFQNVVRAGVSAPSRPSPAADGRDGLGVVFDYTGETDDYYDAAGDFALPVERSRRFVTPFDLFGDGRVGQFDDAAKAGADDWGRVAFDKHFRPAGIPTPIMSYTPADPAFPTTIAGGFADPDNVIDLTTNPLHGFESYRNTQAGENRREAARRYAATPTNLDENEDPILDDDGNPIVTSGGNAIPTYNSVINSLMMGRNISGADQMNLYDPSPHDDPFGYQDLEWLYRTQDREGPSLFSRLADLAPVSFRDSVDAQRRRRLFSIDTWETNAIVWANDNPRDALYPAGRFEDNSRFDPLENASLLTLAARTTPDPRPSVPFVAVPGRLGVTGGNLPGGIEGSSSAPSLAHRDRKINLNYPLPVSNDPDEPTRRKWITESYQLLKTMLPPLSLDTPDELAMLSQFLVNIVDFRDSDATMTRFVNPDVFIRQEAGKTPVLVLAGDAEPDDLPLVQYGMEYNPIAINEVLAYEFQTKMAGGGAEQPVGRFFIELVNTLTKPRGNDASTLNLGGFDFITGDPYSKGCWDLVFTDDEPDVRPDPITGQLLPLPTAGTGHYAPVPLNRESFVENVDPKIRALNKGGPPESAPNYYFVIGNEMPVAECEQNPPANNNPNANNASLALTIKSMFDPMNTGTNPTIPLPPGVLPTPGADPDDPTPYPGRIPALGVAGAPSQYKWVCLRRPANPFEPVSEKNPMVVVDSMRFHFIEGTGIDKEILDEDDGEVPIQSSANQIYSTQRYQPYRGGHAVLDPETNKLDYRYGYTEQWNPASTSVTETWGRYAEKSKEPGVYYPATREIFSSLGQRPVKGNPPNAERDTAWDYFVFNDRDFVSVAELMLVPGCPPGLFTKQFVEFAPTSGNSGKFSTTPPLTAPVAATSNPIPSSYADRLNNGPRSHPYLVDRLFYTSASPGLNGATAWDPVRGPSAGGWYKMFEVFEVPSRAAGAVASAAHGFNYDWFRQDTRPGQLNLNLIIDEEVFLGLMGNAGKRTPQPPTTETSVEDETVRLQQVRAVPPALDGRQLEFRVAAAVGPEVGNVNGIPSADAGGFNAGRGFAPLVVTEWEPGPPEDPDRGAIFGAQGMPTDLAEMQRAAYPISNVGFFAHNEAGLGMSSLKNAFVDFLKLRHGASGYLFGPLPEAPFRSLSYPDINYTIMRPALPTLHVGQPDPIDNTIVNYYVPSDHGLAGRDAGVKNPARLNPAETQVWPPAIPPRRLFQLTDDNNSSNANNQGDADQLGYSTPENLRLQRGWGNLTATGGSGKLTGDANKAGAQHPYWRSEWMQKMMNLATVRTHQYAVWVTVGFFEVLEQGDPALAGTDPDAAYDVIGREVGVIGGRNVRHRGFFIVDRLKLEGFDPHSPGKFREAVVYRRIIQ